MPKKFSDDSSVAKLSLTLSAQAASELRALADRENVTLAELVRRSMGLYRYVQSLDDDEQLAVVNRRTGQTRDVVLVGG